ncbi:MAG: penicillin-binding protein, partial [Chloroflexi bacterium]|nr:penicillin-binding protein [Chloroflexota bacterium]
MRGWMIALVIVLGVPLVMLGAAAGTAYLIYSDFANDLAPPDEIEETQQLLGSSRIFDRNGEEGVLLFEYARPSDGLRAPVRLHRVSQHLIDATVATEDATFWTNQGINFRGLLRAAWENFGVGSSDFLGGSGGSSITQQLVKNVLIPPG